MKRTIYFFITAAFLLLQDPLFSQQTFTFSGNWGNAGFNLERQDAQGIQVVYSVPEFSLENVTVNGKKMQSINLTGIFLPNNAGAPNIPGTGRYLAIPAGAAAHLEIVGMRAETLSGVEIAPAPRIPKETEKGLEYPVNEEIYQTNSFYPSQPVLLSEPTKIRGVDVVMLGFSPFQYNPVTKELKIYKDIRVNIKFEGGQGIYGDNRLRSRWFDPLLQDLLLNPGVLPQVDFNKTTVNTDDVGFEYLIIVPDDPFFSSWADSIKVFRQKQGITTGIKTLSEIGGNNWSIIESYLNNAYANWAIPPVACLLIGDYGSDINNTIDAPIWDSYCVSDNIYGDVDGNSMPDIIMARMTAQDENQIRVMVRKFLDYERTPPTSPGFYNHPISALGWQSDRWFQICSEVIRGFWQNELGKSPVRINAVNWGNPTVDPWSTAQNTADVVNYFGPNGLGYITATPQGIGGFSGGTASQITAALNEGAFILQHRDHGAEDGWGEPAYYNSDIDGLTNTDLSYIMSVNCLTGKYNNSTEVFAEKFHRYTYNNLPAGALGILAASETSYSFVNDAYVWGVYDNMWPDFMPAYGSTPVERGILPAFGNAAGKYFLQQSNWPYNTSEKEVTYNLFHHHGDAFLTVYSEIPQSLSVVHDATILTGVTSFNVTANAGSLICLSLNGEILGTGMGTGSPVSIVIPGTQLPPDMIDVVVTLQNYLRYEGTVTVIPPSGPYVVKNSIALNDNSGNGLMDYGEDVQLSIGVKNVGIVQADNVTVSLTTADPYITLTQNTALYGNIPAGSVITVNNGFAFSVANDMPDNHLASFSLLASDGTNSWPSYFTIKGHAPVLQYQSYSIDDPLGNNNGKLDPGETVTLNLTVKNTGSAETFNVGGVINTTNTNITINSASQAFGAVAPAGTASASFSITADPASPAGNIAIFDVALTADLGITGSGTFNVVIGQIPILIVDLDPSPNSGTVMNTTIQNLGISVAYQTSFPPDLNLYSCIFVCLGVYSSNYELNSSQGIQLKNYLDNGGRLYMEGADTWNYDAPTAVHPYFKITAPSDGSDDLGVIQGQNATFTAGMNFNYDGENNYIDRLNPTSGSNAFTILQNNSPSYGTGIAYDGGTYKTIGCSHEFGGLTDAASPSTKEDLMIEYLTFFGIIPEGLAANFNVANTTLCEGSQTTFNNISTGDPTSWEWSFPGGTPSSSALENPVVTYSNTGIYDVTLIVVKGTESDTLVKTEYIQVITAPATSSTPAGPVTVCNNIGSTVITTAPIPGATSYQWAISPTYAGLLSGTGITVTVNWNTTFSGQASITVAGVNTCGQGPVSSPFIVNVYQAPVVTLSSFSNVCANWPAFQLSGGSPAGGTYSGNGVAGGYFTPSNSLIGYNSITYTYIDNNACSASAVKSIYVDACTGIASGVTGSFTLEIIPNPVHDIMKIKVSGMTTDYVNTRITDLLGEILSEESYVNPANAFETEINTSAWAKGIYFLRIDAGDQVLSRKFIVE
jgi:PKD repeat protein